MMNAQTFAHNAGDQVIQLIVNAKWWRFKKIYTVLEMSKYTAR